MQTSFLLKVKILFFQKECSKNKTVQNFHRVEFGEHLR
jgi:hypothetical protein